MADDAAHSPFEWQGPRRPYDHPDRVATRAARAARERVRLALAALANLQPATQAAIGEAIVTINRAGLPPPAFTTIAAEAESWAAMASPHELKIYVAAAVARLSARDRASLARHLWKAA